jgi:transcriptional regulator with XRE-family HTH domain
MGKVLSEQIRAAVAGSGLSRYRIAKEIGVSQALLSKFMHGKRGLSMEVLDRLGALLGLEIVARLEPRKEEG